MRDENPSYVRRALEHSILAYIDESSLAGKTILDFGCGCGSSTIVLAKLFPKAKIVGVDLVEEFISVARSRADFYALSNITFQISSIRKRFLGRLKCFDFAVLSAVYEHMLPMEREIMIPIIWSALSPGGVLFINQTPFRWFPIENHTTGLPLINYLPDHMTYSLAQKFCKRMRTEESWKGLLRRGIRGASPREIIRIIKRNYRGSPMLLEPCRMKLHDRIDLWYALSSESRLRKFKGILRIIFKIVKYTTGAVFLPSLHLAIRKPDAIQ